MQSDTIYVTNAGEGMQAALDAACASAAYRGLERKSAIRLCLLAEEMMGMMRQITHETQAQFWVESTGMQFELHLSARTILTGKMRRELLKSATSGKNEAAKGVMGKIRDIFDRALTAADPQDVADIYAKGFTLPVGLFTSDPLANAAASDMLTWSLRNYRTAIETEERQTEDAKAEWDAFERSIVANIADEVKIAISGDTVEMTVYKTFDE